MGFTLNCAVAIIPTDQGEPIPPFPSSSLPFTKHLVVHGTILGPDGRKTSKTLGNVIAPLEQYDKFGSDGVRFYMFGVLQTYLNCNYREEDLMAAWNTHLANNFGNLVNRVIHLANQKSILISDSSKIERAFQTSVDEMKQKAEAAYEAFELHDAVGLVNDMVAFGNRYFQKNEPWKQDRPDADKTLNNTSYLIRTASELYEPVIPDGAKKAMECLKKKDKTILF
ncbi:MAG: class I tRNA ligase family protein [Proteobacteria bacterium]|nr:class I tRNA ligase family protein [Pseudomonadota bacterium]MBU4470146.1 class I tRNA ligase family protein [Pseudomonadota bacterium]MCG2753129.1 class I tRNA ligase family protein [Desulfobacteraceae bacterium]